MIWLSPLASHTLDNQVKSSPKQPTFRHVMQLKLICSQRTSSVLEEDTKYTASSCSPESIIFHADSAALFDFTKCTTKVPSSPQAGSIVHCQNRRNRGPCLISKVMKCQGRPSCFMQRINSSGVCQESTRLWPNACAKVRVKTATKRRTKLALRHSFPLTLFLSHSLLRRLAAVYYSSSF